MHEQRPACQALSPQSSMNLINNENDNYEDICNVILEVVDHVPHTKYSKFFKGLFRNRNVFNFCIEKVKCYGDYLSHKKSLQPVTETQSEFENKRFFPTQILCLTCI